MTDFNSLCWVGLPDNQASLSHYTSNGLFSEKLTFVHLRYSLGDDRPSQTTDQEMSREGVKTLTLKESSISQNARAAYYLD